MNIITLDFETYYDKQYSLSKMTTEEYIRDPWFEVIGVAVQVDDGEPDWFSGTKEKTKAFLERFSLHDHIVVAHNAMFDMAILNWHFDIRPKRIVDTLSMARALHTIEVGGSLAALAEYYELGVKGTEVINALGKKRLNFTAEELSRYGDYCGNDVTLTYKLFQTLGADFPLVELKLIDLTIRMFTEPKLELDGGLLKAHLDGVLAQKLDLLSKALITKENLMSNPQLAQTLRNLGVEPPTKISPTTGKETYAFSKTDEGFKALLEHENIIVQLIVAARLGVKSTLEETRTGSLIQIASRGALPVPLMYYGARTGRWSGAGGSINMQNIPRNSTIKYAIGAPKGFMLTDADSSQIECRTVAWLAEQNDLTEAFEKGQDVYKLMASAIYGKPVSDISKDERFVGKVTILSAMYGVGAARLQAALKNATPSVTIPIEEAQRIITTYRETYQSIPHLWKQGGEAIKAMMANRSVPFGRDGVLYVEGNKGIRLPNGMYLKYPNLRKQADGKGGVEFVYDVKRGKTTIATRLYSSKLVENAAQALARIIIGEQMLMINKKYPVVMTVHDAIACLIPTYEVKLGMEFVEMCMRLRPLWALDLPLNCEAGYGKNYGEC
jgi:DNA polymerase